jgi:hypothetical protein
VKPTPEQSHGLCSLEAQSQLPVRQRLGETLEDRYAPFDIQHIKAGEVLGWRGELERQAAAAGEAWQPFQTLDGMAAAA